jgi:hypothetical protein
MMILRPIFTPSQVVEARSLNFVTACGEVEDRCNITQGCRVSKTGPRLGNGHLCPSYALAAGLNHVRPALVTRESPLR